jgi:hypothetical protein
VPPLVFGQPDFTQEGVQMPGQRLHHVPQPGVVPMGERGEDAVDHFLFTGLLLRLNPGHRGTPLIRAHLLASFLGRAVSRLA